MITIGGSAVASPVLTRAIQEFGEQAKKRLDETGSLAGFEAKFSDNSSSDGSVTITISALGAAAYDASADTDDTILAYTVTTAQPDGVGGTATSLSSGSSEVIRAEQDIDAFTTNVQNSTNMIHYGAFIYGTPEELAAANGDAPEAASLSAGIAEDDQNSTGTQSEFFSKLQGKQSTANRLIGLLQTFLDGRDTSKRDSARGWQGTGRLRDHRRLHGEQQERYR